MLCKIIIVVTEQTAPTITKTLSLQTLTYLLPSMREANIALDMHRQNWETSQCVTPITSAFVVEGKLNHRQKQGLGCQINS